jgi:hypothetical protein
MRGREAVRSMREMGVQRSHLRSLQSDINDFRVNGAYDDTEVRHH